jgi:hypothetical protein
MIQAIHPTSSADGVVWNLNDLFSSVDDPWLAQDLDAALQRAETFEATYRGKINVEGGPLPELLLASLVEQESMFEQMDKPAVYAQLLHAAKTDDPKRGALVAKTREARTVINKHLIFFDLEWVKLPDKTARPASWRHDLARSVARPARLEARRCCIALADAPRLLPILLPSRSATPVPGGQLWNVGPAHGRQQTAQDDLPKPTDLMVAVPSAKGRTGDASIQLTVGG